MSHKREEDKDSDRLSISLPSCLGLQFHPTAATVSLKSKRHLGLATKTEFLPTPHPFASLCTVVHSRLRYLWISRPPGGWCPPPPHWFKSWDQPHVTREQPSHLLAHKERKSNFFFCNSRSEHCSMRSGLTRTSVDRARSRKKIRRFTLEYRCHRNLLTTAFRNAKNGGGGDFLPCLTHVVFVVQILSLSALSFSFYGFYYVCSTHKGMSTEYVHPKSSGLLHADC